MLLEFQQRLHLFRHRHAYRQARRHGMSSLAAREKAQTSFPLSGAAMPARRAYGPTRPEFRVSAIARLSGAPEGVGFIH
jgi:hypothetical protein